MPFPKILLIAALSASAGPPEFNRAQTHVTPGDIKLLSQKGFVFTEGGALLSPETQAPVLSEDYEYVIEELRSGLRLKALMEINLILSRNNYEENLPKEDKGAIRKVGRTNWELLSKQTRAQISPYFSAREVFEMNEGIGLPLETSGGGTPSPKGSVATAPAAAPAAPAPMTPPAPQPKAAAPVLPPPLPTEAELEAQSNLKAAAMPLPMGLKAGTFRDPFAAKGLDVIKTAQPAPTFKAEAAPAPPIVTAMAASPLGHNVFKPAYTPPPPPAIPIKESPPSLPKPIPIPIEEKIAYPEYNEDSFSLFLKSSPYDTDTKGLIELIAAQADPVDRRAALGTFMLALPRISKGKRESGNRRLYTLTAGPSGEKSSITLHEPGQKTSKRQFMRGRSTFLLPSGENYYKREGLAIPTLEGSPPETRSKEQQAGSLLHALLAIDTAGRGENPESYVNEFRATRAEFRMYDNIRKESGKRIRLDFARAILYEEWTNRPEDFMDFLVRIPPDRGGDAVKILRDAGVVSYPRSRDKKEPVRLPRHFSTYTPRSRTFRADIPENWTRLEEESGRSSVVHLLGPKQADGTIRAAYHIHFFVRGQPGFVDARKFLKTLRIRNKAAKSEVTALRSWRVSNRPARIFEVREARLLPYDRLPAETVKLHHYYVFLPNGRDEYALIKFSTTERTFVDYRKEFFRFLKSFRITGF